MILPAIGLAALLAAGAAAATPPPRLTAKAALLVDNRTHQVLFARNPDLQLPPASTTKILTALIASHSGQLDRDVRVTRHASETQASRIGLRPGWVMNVRDLVYAILLNSANDASVALAEGLAGSVSDFAEQMNATARAIGATRSRFVNPNGLPADGHYSTVRDLLIIMEHVLHVPFLRETLSTHATVIRPRAGSKRPIVLRSHNRLLGRAHLRVVGKTGWTRRAKRCFVGAALDGERELLVALLGSDDLWGDLERLIDHGVGQADAGRDGPASEANWRVAATHPPEPPAGPDPRAARRPRGRYHVQLASFRSAARAGELREKLARRGHHAVVERLGGRRGPLYRVTVRGFATEAAARQAATAFAKAYRVKPLVTTAGARTAGAT